MRGEGSMYPSNGAWDDLHGSRGVLGPQSRARILVLDDEGGGAESMPFHLGLEGCECHSVSAGREALERIQSEAYDLLVLIVRNPRADGLALCRAARTSRANHDVPIFVVTPDADESHVVACLESGADDYLAKPFTHRELLARAHALLRRRRYRPSAEPPAQARTAPGSGLPDREPVVRAHGIEIDPARRRVRVLGREVKLSDQEFRLLYLLATHAGFVFTREALLLHIWRGDTFVTLRSVDTLVKRLRRRIEPKTAEPRYLLTVWGVGYKLADRELTSESADRRPA